MCLIPVQFSKISAPSSSEECCINIPSIYPCVNYFYDFFCEKFPCMHKTALVFGVWCAKERIFEKIKMIHIVPGYIGNKIIKLFILSIVLVCLYYLRNTFGEWLELWDMIIASAITYFCFEFISSTSFVSHVLKIIGKHSMNMFLTHTFIFLIYLKSFTYSFHNFLLIIIVLIVDTLLLSILIEKIKTWTHFNMLKNKIIKYILKTKVK